MKNILLAIIFLASAYTQAQVISGPMLGHTELRTATVWMQFTPDVKEASATYYKKGTTTKQTVNFNINSGYAHTATATLVDLEPATNYAYTITIDKSKTIAASGELTTQTLWQHREKTTPLPNFSFLTGSCAYINHLCTTGRESLTEMILPFLKRWQRKKLTLCCGWAITGTPAK